MCNKEMPDGVGDYLTCPLAPDHDNPIILKEASVSAVICMDVQSSARFAVVAERARKERRAQNLICIPAAMSDGGWFGGATLFVDRPRTS